MRKTYFLKKYKEIEILKSDAISGVETKIEFVEEVRRAFKNASSVFNFRLDQIKTPQGLSWKVGLRSATSNSPIGTTFSVYLGLFLTSLVKQQVKGLTVLEWLSATNFTIDKVHKEVIETTYNVHSELSQLCEMFATPVLFDNKNIKEVNNYISRLTKNISNLRNSSYDWYIGMDVDIAKYLCNCIFEFISVYKTVFAPGSNEDDVHGCVMEKLPNNGESNKLIEIFEKWQNSNFKLERLQKQLSLFTIDLGNFEIDNGAVKIPTSFYEKLIEYAVTGCWTDTLHQARWHTEFEFFKRNLNSNLINAFAVRHKENTALLPVEFDILLPLDFEFSYEVGSTRATVEWFINNCENVIKDFTEFVKQHYDVVSSCPLPGVATRVAPINGIPSIYRFDFFENKEKVYKTFDCYEVEKLTLDGSTKKYLRSEQKNLLVKRTGDLHSKEDLVKKSIYEKFAPVEFGKFYGSVNLSKSYIKELKNSYKDSKIVAIDDVHYKVESIPHCFTILPPRDTVRQLDVYEGEQLRVVNGNCFDKKPINLDSDQVSLVDLLFAVRRFEADNDLKSIYENRIKAVQSNGSAYVLKDYKYMNIPAINYSILDYSTLLALSGIEDTHVIINKLFVNILNSAFLKENVLEKQINRNKVILDKQKITRFVTFDIPVDKGKINRSLLELYERNKSGSGGFIYKDSELVNRKPFFALIDKKFGHGMDPRFIIGRFSIDLLYHLDIGNRCMKLDEKTLCIYHEPFAPGYNELNGLYGQFGLLQHGDRIMSSTEIQDLVEPELNSYSSEDKLFYIFTTILELAREGEMHFDNFKKNISDVYKFIVNFYNIKDTDTFSVFEGCSSGALIFESFDKLQNATSDNMVEICSNLLKDLKGSEWCNKLHLNKPLDFDLYEYLVDDFYNYLRYPSNEVKVKLNKTLVPFSICPDASILNAICNIKIHHIVTNMLRSGINE